MRVPSAEKTPFGVPPVPSPDLVELHSLVRRQNLQDALAPAPQLIPYAQGPFLSYLGELTGGFLSGSPPEPARTHLRLQQSRPTGERLHLEAEITSFFRPRRNRSTRSAL